MIKTFLKFLQFNFGWILAVVEEEKWIKFLKKFVNNNALLNLKFKLIKWNLTKNLFIVCLTILSNEWYDRINKASKLTN